jgi:hypothetical protein
MREQESRRAQNEAKFRNLNEAIKDLEGDRWSGSRLVDLVCECSSATCMKVVTLPRDDYEAVRAKPTQFVVTPGHEDPSIEDVEKHGEAAAVAERTDPRD